MSVTTRERARTIKEVREGVSALAESVRPRSAEFEQLNDLPADVFDAIWTSGVTQTCVPQALGGVEGTPRDWFEFVVELAVADASVAWIAAQGVVQNAWLSVFAGTDFARHALAVDGALPATSIAGEASLKRIGEQRFELTGQWQFLSGCSGATLIGGLARVAREDGPPEVRFAVVLAEQARITPSWDNVGLMGTGSHNATVGPIEIDAGQTWIVQTGEPQFPHPYECFRSGWSIAVSAAAVQIGIARRALDEIATVVRDKRQVPLKAGTDAPLATNAAILRALARAESTWLSARAGVREALEELWEAAQRGTLTPAISSRCQLAAASAVWLCADVIRLAYTLAGTTAQRTTHPLQRCFRDGHVLTAHTSVNEATFEAIGRSLFV